MLNTPCMFAHRATLTPLQCMHACMLAAPLRQAPCNEGRMAKRHGMRMQDMFIFRVEGTGVLRAEQVVLTALEILIGKLRNLQEALPPDPSDLA